MMFDANPSPMLLRIFIHRFLMFCQVCCFQLILGDLNYFRCVFLSERSTSLQSVCYFFLPVSLTFRALFFIALLFTMFNSQRVRQKAAIDAPWPFNHEKKKSTTLLLEMTIDLKSQNQLRHVGMALRKA